MKWNGTVVVSVALAQGDVMMKQHRDTGTLLTKQSVQPLVPLSQVAALGYRVNWTAQQCSIRHPSRGELEVTLEQGCPTVPLKVGMELMEQVEQLQSKFKVMKMVMEGGPDDGSEEQRRWKELRRKELDDCFLKCQCLYSKEFQVEWHGEEKTSHSICV